MSDQITQFNVENTTRSSGYRIVYSDASVMLQAIAEDLVSNPSRPELLHPTPRNVQSYAHQHIHVGLLQRHYLPIASYIAFLHHEGNLPATKTKCGLNPLITPWSIPPSLVNM